MTRWKAGLLGLMVVACGGLAGCKQVLFYGPEDYTDVQNIGLTVGMENDPHGPIIPADRSDSKAPPTVLDPDRPIRYMTLQECIAIALEQGNVGLQQNVNVTGLGGDVRFLRNEVKGNYYYPIDALGEEFTIFLGGTGGHMLGLGQDTRVSDRFFLGGTTFRGFEFGGVGPRDIPSGDAIGGKQYYKGTVEVRFPLGFQDALDVQGRLFADAGAVWGYDGDAATVNDSSAPRLAIGPGLVWNSPLGLVAIDFGFPIIKEEFDETQLVNFSFGVQF